MDFLVGGFLVIIVMFGSYFTAVSDTHNLVQKRCVAKYSDMPYNKVQAHCKELLEFKNE
jgi:hypothetical protein